MVSNAKATIDVNAIVLLLESREIISSYGNVTSIIASFQPLKIRFKGLMWNSSYTIFYQISIAGRATLASEILEH